MVFVILRPDFSPAGSTRSEFSVNTLVYDMVSRQQIAGFHLHQMFQPRHKKYQTLNGQIVMTSTEHIHFWTLHDLPFTTNLRLKSTLRTGCLIM